MSAIREDDVIASVADALQYISYYHTLDFIRAVGGAAFLVSQAIRASRVVEFAELGMEAVHEFEVRNMPVTVAVSSDGVSVHEAGPKAWRGKFAASRSSSIRNPASWQFAGDRFTVRARAIVESGRCVSRRNST